MIQCCVESQSEIFTVPKCSMPPFLNTFPLGTLAVIYQVFILKCISKHTTIFQNKLMSETVEQSDPFFFFSQTSPFLGFDGVLKKFVF